MTRIAFDISDDAANALMNRVGDVPMNVVVKETLYKLLGVEVEPNAATRRRIETLANREAKARVEREKLAALKEAHNALI